MFLLLIVSAVKKKKFFFWHMFKNYQDNNHNNNNNNNNFIYIYIASDIGLTNIQTEQESAPPLLGFRLRLSNKGQYIPLPLLHQLWSTGWKKKCLNGSPRADAVVELQCI